MKKKGRKNHADGSWQVDLMAGEVGSHFAVNLLLGDRRNSENPLFTTPKSAVDALGRGSFRATGAKQVLATRYVLNPYENGEPANRQFYLVEDGRQIFYSANVHEHVTAAGDKEIKRKHRRPVQAVGAFA